MSHLPQSTEPWMRWAIQLQSLAQCGLAYCKDKYDIERYEKIREISAEILSHQGDLPLVQVKGFFCNEVGYQTPKVATRAAVFQEGKLLLVQETNGKWALPGGWADVLESVKSNTEKEALEEAGLQIQAEKIIAIVDESRYKTPIPAHSIWTVIVLCTLLGGTFQPNSETIATGYFSLDALPPLDENRTTLDQIHLCFSASQSPTWQTHFN